MRFQTLKGFNDILPEDYAYWRFVLGKAVELSDRFGYEQIDTPILEATRLFLRGLQEGSAIVLDKELYSFEDHDGTNVSLRPEFTAGVMRAYVEHGMHTRPRPVKLFAIGPLFRHEKPQAGRFRQHVQFNAELLGEEDAAADLEIMQLAYSLYHELGFKGLQFQLNSIGCPDCRPAYIEKLVAYFQNHHDTLPEVDRRRLRVNPLRVLDTKEEATLALLEEAPRAIDHLCETCREHFESLTGYLDVLALPYVINPRLVRGFDYYVRTVFEVWGEELGAQNALCGGGRYDGLVESVGGPKTPGVGVGIGIERIVLSLKAQGIEPPALPRPEIMTLHLGAEAKTRAVLLTSELRNAGIPALLAFGSRSLKSQLKSAHRAGVRYAVILAEDELARGVATVRDMVDSSQQEVPLSGLLSWLRQRLEIPS
ncbi:MAG: histidine--tRNA ligase [Caldilineae bacterium]|nr:MAG: histidine--tRNA ligase [Caldilineae bacterium]